MIQAVVVRRPCFVHPLTLQCSCCCTHTSATTYIIRVINITYLYCILVHYMYIPTNNSIIQVIVVGGGDLVCCFSNGLDAHGSVLTIVLGFIL